MNVSETDTNVFSFHLYRSESYGAQIHYQIVALPCGCCAYQDSRCLETKLAKVREIISNLQLQTNRAANERSIQALATGASE